MPQDVFQGEMDPDIAALLGVEAGGAQPAPDSALAPTPDFGETGGPESGEQEDLHRVDLGAAGFPRIGKRFEETPHDFFNDPNYYKAALSGEGEASRKIHVVLQKYLAAKDPKDRSVFRQQVIVQFWNFLLGVAKKTPGNIPAAKKYLLRFGMLHPTFISAETRTLFAKIVVENELNQPVYYMDEWFRGVGTGIIRVSTTDEVKVARNNNAVRMQQLLEKALGKLDGAKTLLKTKDQERLNLEKMLQERINIIFEHFPLAGLEDINACYSESQKKTFGEIMEVIKGLLKADRELELYARDYRQAETDVQGLQEKIDEEGGAVMVDLAAIDSEFDTVRQMAKMTVGRQGNHFPILSGEYFHCGPHDIGYRENVISLLGRIESIDPEAYCRVYKNRLNRIAPYVILLPTYGDTGFCWEPFDRFNRATSRGRIVVPMYPKNLYAAVLSAVADLRWQAAKEKASYYWMEEGITGHYYQWFAAQKLKGDVKEFFIQDYILWMTKEAEGIQKLDKEIRGIFWRYMPFSREVKEKLRNRSYVYQELYQRDLNRAMSDGY
ncbi:MAG: hypothetical protein LBS37_03180 [Treponema sp.]|jgi:hypothetical protein|nr:hypothetical protein [Treponema sp.]